jgi:drug/metabolite transporter (DMT)-like permease
MYVLGFCRLALAASKYSLMPLTRYLENHLTIGVRYMLLAVFCFALMNLCVKLVSHIPAAEVVFFRSAISLAMSLYFLRNEKIQVVGRNRKILFLRGAFGGSALILFFITIQNMPLASAVVIHYLAPIFTSLIAIKLLKERIFKRQILFFALSFVGVLMVKGFDERVEFFYFLLGLLSAFLSGCAYNCIRLVKETEHPLVVVIAFPIVMLPVSFVFCWFDWVTPMGWDWLFLLLIGILTQIAQLFMTKAYQQEKAARVASVSYTGIVYALPLGVIFFNEYFDLLPLLGICVVLVGVFFNVRYGNR